MKVRKAGAEASGKLDKKSSATLEARTTPALAPIYTPDDLNPRGKVCQEIVSSVKRGYVLSALCAEWLAFCNENPGVAASMLPFNVGVDSIKRKVKEAFSVDDEYMAARRWADWWPWVFGLWLKGSLDRQLQTAALNLPSSLQAKVKAWEHH